MWLLLFSVFSFASRCESNLLDRSLGSLGLEGGGGKKGVDRLIGGDAFLNTTVLLKKNVLGGSTNVITEPDCVSSIFMSPWHFPVTFTANASYVGKRMDKTCRWNFIGTAPCIPVLTCSAFKLDCARGDYMEVADGVVGSERFCQKPPEKVVGANEMRDLYIRLMVPKVGNANSLFNCTVTCGRHSQKGVRPLKAAIVKKETACTCGVKPNHNRIVGGEDSIPSEFPWLVALVESKTRQPFCGGSIINDRVILTAGHCFKGRYLNIQNIEILLNAYNLDSTPNTGVVRNKSSIRPHTYPPDVLEALDKGNNSFRVYPQEIFVHPLYVSETNDFDVAAILLTEPLKAPHFAPICLPDIPLSYLRTFGHRKATVAGWGLQGTTVEGTPTIQQKLHVNVFSPGECKALYAHRVNRRMICAGYKEGGMDACAGDSGGPLILEDRPQVWVQIGSVSWGEGCAKEKNPGVYFRTTESGQWLRHVSTMGNATWCTVPE